jgi:hypothetical protein
MVPLPINAFTSAVSVTGDNASAKLVPVQVEPVMDSQHVTRPMQPVQQQQVQPQGNDPNGYKASQHLTSEQSGNYKILQPLS